MTERQIAGPEAVEQQEPTPGGVASLRPRLLKSTPGIVAGCWLLIAVCLMFSTPPGASPDEAAHYIRALGVGRGQVVLDDVPPKPPAPQFPVQIAWMQEQSGVVRAPERLAPIAFECWAFPFYVGTCWESDPPTSDRTVTFETYVGTYPPAAYVLPGLLMRATDDPTTALMLGRAGILLVSLLLLGLAVFALYDGRTPRSLAAVLLSVSPMVLAMAAALTSSGVEIAAAICFMACLLRLTRCGPPGWVWFSAAFSGATLAVARDLGPAWVLLELGLAAVFIGFRPLRAIWRSGGRRARIFAAVIGVAMGAALVWRAVEAAQPDLSQIRFGGLTSGEAGGLVRQVVGVFGPLDALMPETAYRVWGAMVLVVVVTGFIGGNRWQRLSLGLAIAATVVMAILLEAVQNIYDFGVQARHILPAAVCITMIAGETVARAERPRWLSSRFLMPVLSAAAAAIHLTAWHTIGRRFSKENAPIVFFTDPAWAPPGGWVVWGVLMAAACGAIVLPFLAAFSNSHRAAD
ncbi:MAG TPA: DUF2142 domain-containing protein [Actinomycetota bacterium]|nr:DUF2142 domain-containing protein [Actinomycetota bacterium]